MSQNNLANPLINISFIVATKYVFLDNLSYTTITYYLIISNISNYITDNNYLSSTSSQNICESRYPSSDLYTTFSTDQPGSISDHIAPYNVYGTLDSSSEDFSILRVVTYFFRSLDRLRISI